MVIGTLNEGSLHHELKKHYATKDTLESGVAARFEVPLEGFVVDIVLSDHRIVEIQTGSFGAMKRKMQRLLDNHQMTLVYPIAVNRRLIRVTETGEVSRRSPKHGSPYDVFSELVYIPTVLDHPNLQLDLVMIEDEQRLVFDGKKGRRRKGWVVASRCLDKILETMSFNSMSDLFDLFKEALPEEFTTADLAQVMSSRRTVGQQAAYCLRAAGVIEITGKHGNSLLYQRIQT